MMTDAVEAEEADVTTTTTTVMIAEMAAVEMITVKSICRSKSQPSQMPVPIVNVIEKETIEMRSGSRREETREIRGSVRLLSFFLKLNFRTKSATSSNHTTRI